MPEIIDAVIQPLGRTPEVLEAPLAKYKPQVVALITNKEEWSDTTIRNIRSKWIKHTHREPEIIVKIIEDPWNVDAIDRYMAIFTEIVDEINMKYKKSEVRFHVGTAGGTNLMGIGSALSAFVHKFPVYYSAESGKYPELSVEELCIEIPFFEMLGPGSRVLKKQRCLKIMKFIAKSGPVQNDAIIKLLDSSPQNASAGRKPLEDAGLIVRTEMGYVATNIGKSLLASMVYEEE